MPRQVQKEHYQFTKYSHKDRWVSYYHQIKESLSLKPSSIIEIGVGDKVFGSYIRNNTDIEYTSVDIDEELKPEIVGTVTSLPLADGSVDMVCAFEILEHVPYEDFLKSLREIHRVSRKYFLMSVPHFGPPVQFFLKIPFLPKIQFSAKLPVSIKHEFNGEHYWEIGKKGHPLNRIVKDLEKLFVIKKDFVPFESQYHHFFVMEKR